MPAFWAETYFAKASVARGQRHCCAKSMPTSERLRDQLPHGNQGLVGNADLVELELYSSSLVGPAEKARGRRR